MWMNLREGSLHTASKPESFPRPGPTWYWKGYSATFLGTPSVIPTSLTRTAVSAFYTRSTSLTCGKHVKDISTAPVFQWNGRRQMRYFQTLLITAGFLIAWPRLEAQIVSSLDVHTFSVSS